MKPRFALSALALLAFFGGTASVAASGDFRTSAWTQEQLTEPFMRSLTKAQCMSKTVASMKGGCSSDKCLKTLSGVSGDCVTWAAGDLPSFCASYSREYIGSYCATNELDARQCVVLVIGRQVYCKSQP